MEPPRLRNTLLVQTNVPATTVISPSTRSRASKQKPYSVIISGPHLWISTAAAKPRGTTTLRRSVGVLVCHCSVSLFWPFPSRLRNPASRSRHPTLSQPKPLFFAWAISWLNSTFHAVPYLTLPVVGEKPGRQAANQTKGGRKGSVVIGSSNSLSLLRKPTDQPRACLNLSPYPPQPNQPTNPLFCDLETATMAAAAAHDTPEEPQSDGSKLKTFIGILKK